MLVGKRFWALAAIGVARLVLILTRGEKADILFEYSTKICVKKGLGGGGALSDAKKSSNPGQFL